MREPASEQTPASSPHRALKTLQSPSEEMRIYVGPGAYIREGGDVVSLLRRGEREECKIPFERGSEGAGLRVYNEKDNLCRGTSAV